MGSIGRVFAPAALVAALVFVTTDFLFSAQTPQTPQPGQGQGATGPSVAGRGGGRGNPAAPLFAEKCAGCHGTE